MLFSTDNQVYICLFHFYLFFFSRWHRLQLLSIKNPSLTPELAGDWILCVQA